MTISKFLYSFFGDKTNFVNFVSNMQFPEIKPITPTVLIIDWCPETRKIYGFNDPLKLADGYAETIRDASKNLVSYDIVSQIIIKDLPQFENGKKLTFSEWGMLFTHQAKSAGEIANYKNMLSQFGNYQNFDEIWMFGAPYFGFYESRMIGKNSIFCNAPPLITSGKKQIVMGFSYERKGGEMLEDFCHRVESIMNFTEKFLWKQFIRDCGSVHCPPNTKIDYDWGNKTEILSNHLAWYDFPNYTNKKTMVNSEIWGKGDITAHHTWWLEHLPLNWWRYVVDLSILDTYQEYFGKRNVLTSMFYKDKFNI